MCATSARGLAVGARGYRAALDTELEDWVVEEKSVFLLNIYRGHGQARLAFRTWGSGGDGIYRSHTPWAVRARLLLFTTQVVEARGEELDRKKSEVHRLC